MPSTQPDIRKRFDRGSRMSKGLQARIDGWRKKVPRSQFKMYGPLSAWLYHRFPPTSYLVKPQKLLREVLILEDDEEDSEQEDTEGDSASSSEEEDDDDVDQDLESDDEVEQEQSTAGDEDGSATARSEEDEASETRFGDSEGGGDQEGPADQTWIPEDESDSEGGEIDPTADMSTDSHDVLVGNRARYPDFTVDQCWGQGLRRDIVRVVIEVASLGACRAQAERQLHGYLNFLGPSRWERQVLGMLILGTDVLIIKRYNIGHKGTTPDTDYYPYKSKWVSLWDKRVVTQLNTIRRLSKTDYPPLY